MRFRHMNIDMNFSKISRIKKFLYDSCKKEKIKKQFFRRIQNSIYQKNECFDSNLMNFLDFTTFDEYKYEIYSLVAILSELEYICFALKMNSSQLLKNTLCS